MTPHTSRLPVKNLRRLSDSKEKSKGIYTEECPEKYNFLLFLRIHN